MELFGVRLTNNVNKPSPSGASKFVNSVGNGCNIVKKLDTIESLQIFYNNYTEIEI